MADFRASIPGWLDALKLEAEQHNDSFVNPHDDICGVPIRHLSLVDIARLSRMGNRLFSGNFPSFVEFCALPTIKADAVAFLVYQHVKPSANPLRCMYRRFKYNRLDMGEVYAEMVALLNATYMDSLGTTGGGTSAVSLWAGMVDYIDLLATEYGWSGDYILNMPYRQLIQCVRRISKRKDPKAIISSTSDRVSSRWLAEQNN